MRKKSSKKSNAKTPYRAILDVIDSSTRYNLGDRMNLLLSAAAMLGYELGGGLRHELESCDGGLSMVLDENQVLRLCDKIDAEVGKKNEWVLPKLRRRPLIGRGHAKARFESIMNKINSAKRKFGVLDRMGVLLNSAVLIGFDEDLLSDDQYRRLWDAIMEFVGSRS